MARVSYRQIQRDALEYQLGQLKKLVAGLSCEDTGTLNSGLLKVKNKLASLNKGAKAWLREEERKTTMPDPADTL